MEAYIIHFDDKPWEDLDDELYYRCFEIPWFSTTKTTISRLTPYTEDSAYAHGYTEAESKYREIRDELEKQAFEKGYGTAVAEQECAVRKAAEKAYQKGLSDAWEAARKIYGSATKHGLPTEVITKIFRDNGKENFNYWDIVEDFSPAEAINRIQQYEQAQKEKEEQEEKDSVTAEDVMRQYLDTFCKGKWCCARCPLNTPDFTCGRGYHFLSDSRVSDEEVRRAYVKVLQKIEEN